MTDFKIDKTAMTIGHCLNMRSLILIDGGGQEAMGKWLLPTEGEL